MRDWRAFVRERLRLPDLAPEREARIVREVATQLEDLYRDTLAHGAADADADARAAAHITDWARLAADVLRADRVHAQPRLDRFVATVERRPTQRRSLLMFATAIFSVVNGVLLQPLPYPHSDDLVRVHEIVPNYGLFAVAPANVFDWRQQNHVFDGSDGGASDRISSSATQRPERLIFAVS